MEKGDGLRLDISVGSGRLITTASFSYCIYSSMRLVSEGHSAAPTMRGVRDDKRIPFMDSIPRGRQRMKDRRHAPWSDSGGEDQSAMQHHHIFPDCEITTLPCRETTSTPPILKPAVERLLQGAGMASRGSCKWCRVGTSQQQAPRNGPRWLKPHHRLQGSRKSWQLC